MAYINPGVDSYQGGPLFSAITVAYGTPQGADPWLAMWTPGQSFAKDELRGFLVRTTKGETFSVNIKGNEATTTAAQADLAVNSFGLVGCTLLYLQAPLDPGNQVTEDNYGNNFSSHDIGPPDYTFNSYSGLAAIVEQRGTFITGNIGFPPVPSGFQQPPYFLGEASGAACLARSGAGDLSLGRPALRRLFIKGERVYMSQEMKRSATVTPGTDTLQIIGGFGESFMLKQNVDCDGARKIYIVVTASGSNRTLKVYSSSGLGTKVAEVTYTAPGVYDLVPVSAAFTKMSLQVIVNNMNTTPGTITVQLTGTADDYSAYFSPAYSIIRLYTTSITTLQKPATVDDETFYNFPLINPKVAYYEIIKNQVDYLISENQIAALSPSPAGYFSVFDPNSREYLDISSLVQSSTLLSSNPYGAPYVSISAFRSNIGTVFPLNLPLVPKLVSMGKASAVAPVALLVDRDRTTSVTVASTDAGNGARTATFYLKVFPPENFSIRAYKDVFCLFDMTADSGSYQFNIGKLYIRFYDVNGMEFYSSALQFDSSNPSFERFISWTIPMNGFMFPAGQNQNYLPDSYYANGGNDDGQGSIWNQIYPDKQNQPVAIQALFKIPADVLEGNGAAFAYDGMEVVVNTPKQQSPTVSTLTVYLKQAGFIGATEIDLANVSTYARVIGELNSDSLPVTDIYRTVGWFMGKDGSIASLSGLQGNLNSPLLYTGSGAPLFPVGIQLQDAKTSKDWITELTRQAWFCWFPDRKNDMRAVNWLIKQTDVPTFADTQSNILTNSISMEKTDFKRVWNSFDFQYHYDPQFGARRHIKIGRVKDTDLFPFIYESTNVAGDSSPLAFDYAQITVDAGTLTFNIFSTYTGVSIGTICSCYGSGGGGGSVYYAACSAKIDLGGGNFQYKFPAATGVAGGTFTDTTWIKQGSATPAWTTFVSGFPTGVAYWDTAQALWYECRASYAETLIENPAPANLQELTYFVDLGLFYGDPAAQSISTLAALNSAKNHAYWSTKQKDVFPYRIPLTSTTAVREMLDWGTVTDEIFTDGETRPGWVCYIEDEVKTDSLKIKLMANPAGILFPTEIVETGDSSINIVEAGDNTNEIVETGET